MDESKLSDASNSYPCERGRQGTSLSLSERYHEPRKLQPLYGSSEYPDGQEAENKNTFITRKVLINKDREYFDVISDGNEWKIISYTFLHRLSRRYPIMDSESPSE